jgi:hypothetical protein
MKSYYLLLLLILLVFGCKKDNDIDLPIEFAFEFDNGNEGWIAGFADYPEGEEEFYELNSAISRLPEPLPLASNAFLLEGNNHSDDLFMYMKWKLSGLERKSDYKVRFYLDFASNAAEGSFGIGGSPANSVYIKAGVSITEPLSYIEPIEGWYRMNIDKGNQAQGGDEMIILGDFSNGTNKFEYTMVSRSNKDRFLFSTDENGECWLIVGVDSGFEGKTSIYFDCIRVLIEK